jgi:hypothetical protein
LYHTDAGEVLVAKNFGGGYSSSAMGMKSFFIKKALQAKGVPKDQAEMLADKLSNNPGLAESLKKLEENKEVKELFEKIQKEMEEKKKGGMPEEYAMMSAMSKYKEEIAKYREELAPLMELMMGNK